MALYVIFSHIPRKSVKKIVCICKEYIAKLYTV